MKHLFTNDQYEEMNKKLTQAEAIASILITNVLDNSDNAIANIIWNVNDLIEDVKSILTNCQNQI